MNQSTHEITMVALIGLFIIQYTDFIILLWSYITQNKSFINIFNSKENRYERLRELGSFSDNGDYYSLSKLISYAHFIKLHIGKMHAQEFMHAFCHCVNTVPVYAWDKRRTSKGLTDVYFSCIIPELCKFIWIKGLCKKYLSVTIFIGSQVSSNLLKSDQNTHETQITKMTDLYKNIANISVAKIQWPIFFLLF